MNTAYREDYKWEPYYTTWPQRINGKWYWRSYVWRKQADDGTYVYGDDFDKLKEDK